MVTKKRRWQDDVTQARMCCRGSRLKMVAKRRTTSTNYLLERFTIDAVSMHCQIQNVVKVVTVSYG